MGEGEEFEILGKPIDVDGMLWTPVRSLNEEDPEFVKTDSLEVISNKQ